MSESLDVFSCEAVAASAFSSLCFFTIEASCTVDMLVKQSYIPTVASAMKALIEAVKWL